VIDSLVLEQKLQKHFQKNIKILLNEKVLRTGKFILFAPKEYYLVFCINSNNKNKYLEIPLPFKIIESESTGEIIFDYKVELLTDDITLKIKVDEYFKLYKSKYLNNKLAFHFS
jgi:hypothetical protein